MKARLRPSVLLVLLLQSGCQRTDNVGPVEPLGASAPSRTRQAAAPIPAPLPSCLVPLASTPPALAKPAAQCPTAPRAPAPLPRGQVKFLGGTQPSIEVELAVTPADQQRGLMYRTGLAADSGMLFSWSNETIHTFWMHNTCIPLDMLFINAEGVITGILEQVPVLNDDPRSIPCPTAHVLEVNAGYCRRHGIAPGQRVRIRGS